MPSNRPTTAEYERVAFAYRRLDDNTVPRVAERANVSPETAHTVIDYLLAALRAQGEAVRLRNLPPERRGTLRVPSRINDV